MEVGDNSTMAKTVKSYLCIGSSYTLPCNIAILGTNYNFFFVFLFGIVR